METRSEAKSTHRGSRSDLFLLSFVRPPSRMKLLPSSESMDARFSLPLHNLTLGPKLMPDPVAGGHALYMNLISGCRLSVAIPTNVLSSVQAASRAVFSPWPVFHRGIYPFRWVGLPRIHRKRGPGPKHTSLGNRIMPDPGASMHSSRPCTVPVLEGWEEGGVSRCKIGPNGTYETSRGY